MDHMNPLDAEFLYLEDGTAHMHIASCAVFEGPAPAYDDMVALFKSKLPLVPRYRQRVHFVPMDLGRPVWVDDPHFDLEYHVRNTALPPPGDKADLCRLMGRLMSQELDRARPLWEAWIVEGLAGGRWAVVSKVHHSMVDGVAGVDLVSVVLDRERVPATAAIVDDWEPGSDPSGLQLTVDAAVNLITSPRDLLRAAWTTVRAPAARWNGAVPSPAGSFRTARHCDPRRRPRSTGRSALIAGGRSPVPVSPTSARSATPSAGP